MRFDYPETKQPRFAQRAFGSPDGQKNGRQKDVANIAVISCIVVGLRKTYKETEKPFFRVAGRERYITKTVSTTKTTQKNKIVPHGSGSYSILDAETGETLIPFGDYSSLSTDLYSNYFKLKLDGFINNRSYRILLRLRLNDGRYRIFDNNFDFKVIK